MVGEEERYRRELEELRKEHTELDRLLSCKHTGVYDQLRIQRMKKRKLWLRDRMNYIERIIYPDIIA